MSMMKVDKDLISKRFSKAVGTYDGAAAVQDAIAELHKEISEGI